MERPNSDVPVEPALPADLTADRRRRERGASAHRAQQDAVRQIVDCLADGVVMVDDEGVIRFANPAAERLFGRTATELVGQEFGFPLTSAEATEIEIVRRGNSPVVCELRLVD